MFSNVKPSTETYFDLFFNNYFIKMTNYKFPNLKNIKIEKMKI